LQPHRLETRRVPEVQEEQKGNETTTTTKSGNWKEIVSQKKKRARKREMKQQQKAGMERNCFFSFESDEQNCLIRTRNKVNMNKKR
jgi:hypothetical protein